MGGCQRDGERGEGKNKKRGGGEEKLGGETSGVVLWLTAERKQADYSKTPNHDYLLTF